MGINHLCGEPFYIQRNLIKYIDFTKSIEKQNIAYDIVLNQISRVQELALSSIETNNVNLFESLLINIFSIESISDEILLEVALSYTDYIFKNGSKKTIENKIDEFKKFIEANKNKNKIIEIYMMLFDKHRRHSEKDYISYTQHGKDKENKENYWKEIYQFLTIKQKRESMNNTK